MQKNVTSNLLLVSLNISSVQRLFINSLIKHIEIDIVCQYFLFMKAKICEVLPN